MGNLFSSAHNPGVLAMLRQRFGEFPEHNLVLPVTGGVMLRMIGKITSANPRWGEVVMVVPNGAGRIWLHTKPSYPAGVYRLMTGGLNPGEAPHEALQREVEEETGFKVAIDRCLAIVTYKLVSPNLTAPFVSYIFLTTPGKGRPRVTDSSEAISGFETVSRDGLYHIAQQLQSLDGEFREWGIFRAVAHTVAAAELIK